MFCNISLYRLCYLPYIGTTPFCITGWPIVDNQLNDTFGNRHSTLPIGGVHKQLTGQQNWLDFNWPICKTLRPISIIFGTGVTHRLVSICLRHSANGLACRQNPPALCTSYNHLSNAIVNAENQIYIEICVLKTRQTAIIPKKGVYCLNVIEQIPQDPCSAFYGLPTFAISFVDVYACVKGWMVEKAGLCDICAFSIYWLR